MLLQRCHVCRGLSGPSKHLDGSASSFKKFRCLTRQAAAEAVGFGPESLASGCIGTPSPVNMMHVPMA